ncbi:MAG: hypothetical protein ACI3VX_00745 [Faecousia sp.]
MNCKRCGKALTEEEIQTNLCYECGEIINQELFDEDSVDMPRTAPIPPKDISPKVETPQKNLDYKNSSFDVAGTINVYITILSVLALIVGVALAVQLESFLVFLYVAIGTSVVYCFFRMLTVIAHLLADIKENTTPNRKGSNTQPQRGNKKR